MEEERGERLQPTEREREGGKKVAEETGKEPMGDDETGKEPMGDDETGKEPMGDEETKQEKSQWETTRQRFGERVQNRRTEICFFLLLRNVLERREVWVKKDTAKTETDQSERRKGRKHQI